MKEEQIFHQALEQPLDQRASFLDTACAGDDDLLKSVEVLLQAHANPGSFLESPPLGLVATVAEEPVTEKLGTVIGPYKLLEQIGEGGMGVVYMAEQQQPVRRKVALKIIKPGMDTKDVIARFEAERQALALMDHPNIAKVHDAGSTDVGHPYFVMELVRGIPITEYCNQNQLTTRERLELFIQICRAVEHAHQQGVIHRDLKPSNVMVTLYDGIPVPKIIDFGVAKATNQQLTERTLFTAYNQMIGTPLYMSPEQAEMSGLGVDTRSDIYSLGVLLYELLVGTTPFDNETLKKAGYDEMRRIIREDEPAKPSSRISTLRDMATTVSQQRNTDSRKLTRLIAGDLDWIAMKALEKNRDHRYESAQVFAEDVRRYLDNKPILATRPSVATRVRKWTQRHRSLTAVMLILTVCGPLVGYGVFALLSLQKPALQGTPPPQIVEQLPTALAPGKHLPGLAPEPTFVPDIGRWQMITKQPRGVMRSAVWSPNEELIALAEAGNVRIYDAASLRLLRVLVGHTRHVTSVAWHPGGARLASASWDGAVRLWTAEGVPTHVLNGHAGEVYCVAWHPDGKQLASAGADGTVRLWNAEGTSGSILGGHKNDVFCLAWSPDGKLLATGGGDIRPPDENSDPGDNAIRIWNIEAGKVAAMLQGHQLSVLSVAWHPDGKQLASGDGNVFRSVGPVPADPSLLPHSTVRLWSVGGVPGRVLTGSYGSIYAVAFSPDGRQLAFGGRLGIVRLWNPAEEMEATTLTGHLVDLNTIAWNSTGTGLLTTSRDSMRLWQTAGTPMLTLKRLPAKPPKYVAWSPDGKWITSAGKLWHADGTPGPKLDGALQPAAWHPNCKWLATQGVNGGLRLWHPDGTPGPVFPSDQSGAVTGLAWHPTGERLASSSSDGTVRVWKSDGTEEWIFKSESEPLPQFRSVAWHPDGGRLAAASWVDAAVRVWDEKGKLLALLKGHRGGVQSVDWSPDGNWLVSSGGGSVRLWKPDGTPGPVLTGHTDEVYGGVAWSPDGRWIASGSTDATVRLWKPDGTPGRVLRGHHGGIHSLAWSPDSRHVVSAGWLDSTLRVWNIETGKTEWQALILDTDGNTVTLSPSGQPLHGDQPLLKQALMYLVEEPTGAMEILTFSKFQKRYAANFISLYGDRVKTFVHQRKFDEAQANYRKLLVFRFNEDPKIRSQVSQMLHNNLGSTFQKLRQYQRAHVAFTDAIEIQQQLVDEFPKNSEYRRELARYFNNWGWYLATHPNPQFRNSAEAVEVATKAVQIAPKNGVFWNTLGVAQYYADDWPATIQSLNKAQELFKGDHEAFNAFFLAMAHWRLGHKEEARKWHNQATRWMDENDPTNIELRRFRAEAEQLLEIVNSETRKTTAEETTTEVTD